MTARNLALRLIPVLGIGLLSFAAPAQTRKYLNIGDPAPAFRPLKWTKGQAVTRFEPGKIYVVEFWATWCTPCKANIPRLTALAKRFQKDVVVTGTSIWENNDNTDAAYIPKVEKFVKGEGDRMNYRVAIDTPNRTVADAWMKAADESGIPTSFVIGRDGKIAWIGHDPDQLDKVIEQVVAKTFDVAAARDRRALEVGTLRPIREALDAKKYTTAVQLLDAAIAKEPQKRPMYTYDRLVALFHVNVEQAKKDSEAVLEETQHDIGVYRMVASIMATQKDLSRDAYLYGRELVDQALAKNEMKFLFLGMNSEILDSLGDLPGAIKSQEAAVAAAEVDPHTTKEFVAFLKKSLEKLKGRTN